MIHAVKDSIQDLFSYIPDNKKAFISISSILNALDTLDRDNETLKEENNTLQKEIDHLLEQNKFQSRFEASLENFAFENVHTDSDSSVDLSSSESYEYEDAEYDKGNIIDSINVDDLIQTFKKASEEKESEIQKLSENNSELMDTFEELFGNEYSDVLDDAELENLQLRQKIEQLQNELDNTKNCLSYVLKELANAFNFKEIPEIQENNPSFQDFIQQMISNIQDSKIHMKESDIKDKYNILAKKYKQIRAENNRARVVLTRLSGEDASKGNLEAIIANTCTKVVKLAAQEANKRFFVPLQNIQNKTNTTFKQVLNTTAKLTQLQLAVTLVYLGRKQCAENEKQNARSLFNAVFPQALDITEESDVDYVESKIEDLRQSVEQLAEEIGTKIPVGSVMSQLQSMRCSLVMKGSTH